MRLNETGAPLAGDALLEAAAGVQVIVADRAVPAPAGLFAALPALVAFCRGAVDIRTVDVAAASAVGVLVTRASPGFVPAVCELIIGLAVDLCRGLSAAVAEHHAGRRPPVRMGRQIAGSTVGIIGYGAIGRELARLMQALGATVVIADPYVSGVETLPLPSLLERSDLVVCLAIANAETANLLDAAAFARMRPGALFINASRGELVDEAALAGALERGHLAGAALDVGRDPDQMPSLWLARRPDVLATPHIGGLTRPAADHQALETVRQVRAILAGTVPEGAVNPDSASRMRKGASP
ncbi:MAG: NAD(P)-dependent oxidoreductase [Acetobacteraceae bacterium]|nr:NAD(P)-dependent oxidoreductase [Acetobacteraceae bacterium]